MLTAIVELFSTKLVASQGSAADRQDVIQLATAALLVEVSRADFSPDSTERRAVEQALVTQFGVSEPAIQGLLAEAESEVEASISLHQFTRLINEHFSVEQKLSLVESMWRVAFADGHLDKYEDYLIRKVADLIYVPHSDFIRCKLRAQQPSD